MTAKCKASFTSTIDISLRTFHSTPPPQTPRGTVQRHPHQRRFTFLVIMLFTLRMLTMNFSHLSTPFPTIIINPLNQHELRYMTFILLRYLRIHAACYSMSLLLARIRTTVSLILSRPFNITVIWNSLRLLDNFSPLSCIVRGFQVFTFKSITSLTVHASSESCA